MDPSREPHLEEEMVVEGEEVEGVRTKFYLVQIQTTKETQYYNLERGEKAIRHQYNLGSQFHPMHCPNQGQI